ncbi:programmed cell death 1 ligand 1 [Triplophysa rosa]|nr:programmed cell death 1 ligand 1 [Triplophysa rosa]
MRETLVLVFQALLWPAVSALFTVEKEQSSYEARLHDDIKLVCTFSKVKSLSDLHVIWRRIEPKPEEEVYRYKRGRKMQNFTHPDFRERAHLIHEQLNQNRAVLQLKKLRIKDSGIYQCIVKVGDDGDYDGDYKDITLSVTALHNPVKKKVQKTQLKDEVELSCEFEGYPLAQILWSDGQNINLTEKSRNSTRSTNEDLFNVTTRLAVRRDLSRNYTCSFLTEGRVRQTATFLIPHEIPSGSSHQYVWIGAVVVVLLVIVFVSIFHHRRKHSQKDRRNEASKCSLQFPQTPANTDSLLTVNENRAQIGDITREEHVEKLQTHRDALTQQYSRPVRDEEQTAVIPQ